MHAEENEVGRHGSRRSFRDRCILASTSLLALLLACAAMEAVLRTSLDSDHLRRLRSHGADAPTAKWTNHPFLPLVGVPSASYDGVRTVNGVERRIEVRNNDYGFRTHPFERKQESDFVVVCLGGSTTWGEGAQDNAATWPELLEAMLAERLPDRRVRVYNFGTPTASSAYSLVAFSLIGRRLEPDVVIVYHGINELDALTRTTKWDYSHASRDLGEVRGPLYTRLPSWMRASVLALWTAELLDGIGGNDDLAAHVNHRRGIGDMAELTARTVRAGGIAGVVDDASVQLFFENLASIEALAALGGGHTLFSTFQFAEPAPGSTALNDALRRWLRDNRKTWVDLDALFPDGDPELNFDACHFTDEGRRRVAGLMFDAIVERGWTEGRERRSSEE